MNIEGWTELCLAEILCSKNDKSKQVKSSEYQLIGLYPIVDQSSDFICGYCDDSKKVINNELPYTIFGDHTRHTKFVNFPFVVGADGTQIIKPIQSVDDRFFFYLVSDAANKIGNYGYDRHFKHLREFRCIFPINKKEQEKIAEVLSTIDRAIAQTEAIIAKQQRIKTGLMQDLLTKGIDENGNIRSEATHKFKDSAIGRIPVEWEVELLDKLGERGSGHTPNKSHPNYWNGGIKWVSLADSSKLDQIYIFDTDKEISTQGLKNSSAVLHPKGTVILSRDAGVGKSAILGTEMAVSQHFIVWRCGKNLNNHYLYYWLQKEKPKFEGIASGSTIVTIGLQFFRQYQIAIPKLIDEQNIIAEIIKKSDECISKHRCTLEKLKRRKTGLMQDLLTGKVRVTNLLKEKEPTSP
jgi:restriction endonuclease S subunit